MLRLARRVHVLIGQPVVHRAHSGRVEIPDHVHLDGSGLAGEKAQPVSGRVTAEVHQDVDPIGANEALGLLVRAAMDVAPFLT